MKILVVNSKQTYAGKIAKLRENCAAAGLHLDLWDQDDKGGVVAKAKAEGYDVLLHRNEHGRLFADRDVPRLQYGVVGWIQESLDANIPVLSMDFGYLDHYNTVAFDFYRRPDLSSAIHSQWSELPDEVNWKKAPKYIRQYRADVLERVATADGSAYAGKVGVWMQWGTALLRPELQDTGSKRGMPQHEWLNRICAKVRGLGLEPVIKLGIVDHPDIYKKTVPFIDRGVQLVTDKRGVAKSNPRAAYNKQANWQMVAGCSYHILLCSSVSHLMVLTQKPVIATGGSWFNALGVFEEPVTWNHPFARPQVNHAARAKWINWWLRSQAPWEDAASALLAVAARAKAHYA